MTDAATPPVPEQPVRSPDAAAAPAFHQGLTVISAVVAVLASISIIVMIGIMVSERSSRRIPPSALPPNLTPSKADTPSPGGTDATSVSLSRGDCVKSLPSGRTVSQVTLVPCGTAHAAQVGATFTPNDSTYPGAERYDVLIRRGCPARLSKVVRSNAPALSWTGYYPESLAWAHGDRSIKCLLLRTDGKPLTRSVLT